MKPANQLFIMCDQLRHDWLGYRGASHVRTPNIDRIAARGRVFTQTCTNSPVCAPARIGLATGMRPHLMGALDNHAFLPLSRPTYYQRLRDHGCQVGCVGKLDLGKPDGYNWREGKRPLTYAWGFTHPLECEGKMHAGRGNPPNGPYTSWL
jgi:choline-sulfatase